MKNRERSYDLTYYPIKPDKPPIQWNNADNNPQEIEIQSEDNVTIKNYRINSKDTFSFKFANISKYKFQFPQNPWIKGIVDVTKKLETKKTELKDTDIYLHSSTLCLEMNLLILKLFVQI